MTRVERLASLAIGLAFGGTLHPGAAHATECGYALRTQWNVPNGGVVLSRSLGPVQAILDATGEWNTHTVISHGNGWVSHSAPGDVQTTGNPSRPISNNWLLGTQMGPSQITLAALFAYYFQYRACSLTSCSNYGDPNSIFNWSVPATIPTRSGAGNGMSSVVQVPLGAFGRPTLVSQEWMSGNAPFGEQTTT